MDDVDVALENAHERIADIQQSLVALYEKTDGEEVFQIYQDANAVSFCLDFIQHRLRKLKDNDNE